jgi:glycerophosphoryl diester phosphodiesterase
MLRQNCNVPRIIAHRALTNGPNKILENQPSSIDKCISQGYMVEVDVWVINEEWFLGHDGPQIPSKFN